MVLIRVWDELEQEMVDVPDPPAEVTMRDIWAQNKLTQKKMSGFQNMFEGLKTNQSIQAYGLAALWALLLVIAGVLVML